jgi:ribosome-binding factor A
MAVRDPRRPDRVAEAVREEIATLISAGVKDPRVTGFVTITGVEMTRDLAIATVFVSIYGEEAVRTATLEGLQASAPSMRAPVGRALKLRLAPNIIFRIDESVARAARIETLLNSVKPSDPAHGGEPSGKDEPQ